MRVFILALAVVLLSASQTPAQDASSILLQRTLLRCEASLYPLLSRQADGLLVDSEAMARTVKDAFEKANPGKSVDKDWKVIDAPKKPPVRHVEDN